MASATAPTRLSIIPFWNDATALSGLDEIGAKYNATAPGAPIAFIAEDGEDTISPEDARPRPPWQRPMANSPGISPETLHPWYYRLPARDSAQEQRAGYPETVATPDANE